MRRVTEGITEKGEEYAAMYVWRLSLDKQCIVLWRAQSSLKTRLIEYRNSEGYRCTTNDGDVLKTTTVMMFFGDNQKQQNSGGCYLQYSASSQYEVESGRALLLKSTGLKRTQTRVVLIQTHLKSL